MPMHFLFLLKKFKVNNNGNTQESQDGICNERMRISFYFTIINSLRVFKENTWLDSVFVCFGRISIKF